MNQPNMFVNLVIYTGIKGILPPFPTLTIYRFLLALSRLQAS